MANAIEMALRNLLPKVRSCCCGSYSRGICTAKELTVLGIESSCDDTGVGVVTSSKRVLGQAVHSQLPVHLKYVTKKRGRIELITPPSPP